MLLRCGIFTPRQNDVAVRLIQGKTNKQIGKELGLQEKSVKGHVTAIMYALGCTNRTEAAIILLNVARQGNEATHQKKSVMENTPGRKLEA